MPPAPAFDILGFGVVAVDDLLYVDRYPPPESKVAGTTGCGDGFQGAYASALARGKDLHRRVILASAAAGLRNAIPLTIPSGCCRITV